MRGITAVLCFLRLVAGYRQQLPSAFMVEPELDTGTPRQILEPCEMTFQDPSFLNGNASFFVQRGIPFALPRPLHVPPLEVFRHKGDKVWKEAKSAPSPFARLASVVCQELTVFGTEVMLGAAICVGAAVQRRISRTTV